MSYGYHRSFVVGSPTPRKVIISLYDLLQLHGRGVLNSPSASALPKAATFCCKSFDLVVNFSCLRSLSHLFGKNYEMAMAIFESYYGTLKATRERPSFEESEMLLYKAMILEESGDKEGCLKFLQDRESEIVDLIALREKKAELLFLLSRKDEARTVYEQLLEGNPENYDYHRGLQVCASSLLSDKCICLYAFSQDFLPRRYSTTMLFSLPISCVKQDFLGTSSHLFVTECGVLSRVLSKSNSLLLHPFRVPKSSEEILTLCL